MCKHSALLSKAAPTKQPQRTHWKCKQRIEGGHIMLRGGLYTSSQKKRFFKSLAKK